MNMRVTDTSVLDVALLSHKARAARSESGQSAGTQSRADGFDHVESVQSPYTDYAADGTYAEEREKVLPARYYENATKAKVFYKGGSVTYTELLEEAVRTGEVVLDESQSVWANLEAAQKALIDDKAKPLFPWSSKLYSEDGQYVFRVENGQITGATATFCTVNGKRISILDMAEQIASGKPMSEVEGDTSMLMRLDPELYNAAREIGNAKAVFAQQTAWYENGEITLDRYLDELGPAMILLFGKNLGKDGLEALKGIFADPDYGHKALLNFGTPVSEWADE